MLLSSKNIYEVIYVSCNLHMQKCAYKHFLISYSIFTVFCMSLYTNTHTAFVRLLHKLVVFISVKIVVIILKWSHCKWVLNCQNNRKTHTDQMLKLESCVRETFKCIKPSNCHHQILFLNDALSLIYLW